MLVQVWNTPTPAQYGYTIVWSGCTRSKRIIDQLPTDSLFKESPSGAPNYLGLQIPIRRAVDDEQNN